MAKRNNYIANSCESPFVDIQRIANNFSQICSQRVIDLGICDTSRPIPKVVTEGLASSSLALGDKLSYRGYSDIGGNFDLREAVANIHYDEKVSPDEVFISDGAKCDVGRLGLLFDNESVVAIQDPCYPIYEKSSIVAGKRHFVHLPCTVDNGFFPDLSAVRDVDIIYFCSPNNPTGAAATHSQLKDLVTFAKKCNAIIIFDAVYSKFISDENLPRSIFDIEGARDVAIEVNSFSKSLGFSGVRLGWSVIPKELRFDDGSSVRDLWRGVLSATFNGASNVVQGGGLVALKNWNNAACNISYYMENASILRGTLEEFELDVFGGDSAPFLWVNLGDRNSMDVFTNVLRTIAVVTMPGSAFGNCGEHFLRVSSLASREDVVDACYRLQNCEDSIAAKI